MIKVKSVRQDGSLFHYGHFICDCLFTEIISGIFNYREVVREKTLHQTIGNFNKIYTEVMMIHNTELLPHDFNNLNVDTIILKNKENYCEKKYFDLFRNFIFTRYNIKFLEYNIAYPEVILVKRNNRINLIDDPYLSSINTNVSTGKERREINNIDVIEKILITKYKNKFKCLYFETLPFEEQIKYFNNAKVIICAHGAVMANMFFCKKGATIVEVTCGSDYSFCNKMAQLLNLNHIKCPNHIDLIVKAIIN